VAGGADDLNLAMCYNLSTGSITAVGNYLAGLQVQQNTRVPMSLNAVIDGLAVGSYQVGLCGYSGSDNWNSNDFSYTSAVVFTVPD